MAHARCTMDKQGYKRAHKCTSQSSRAPTHTHTQICTNYRFSTATVVSRMCINITLHELCLSCYWLTTEFLSRSQWPSGLRRRSTADRLLRLRVWIPPGTWMFVLCVLYNKDKRQSQDIQDKEVRKKYKARTKKNPSGVMDVCRLWVLCVCQVEDSAKGRSLVQRSPTDCGV
jgi:hypothetical protein